MDNAVALVQAYLRVNGYFTVSEYPVLEATRSGGHQMATDLDVLALRFPGAGRLVPGESGGQKWHFEPDPRLEAPPDRVDMLIAEVKEGRARLNPAMRDPEVIRTALARFGCCSGTEGQDVVRTLLGRGSATTEGGHRVRVIAFGTESASGGAVDVAIPLAHVIRFLQDYLSAHWAILRHAEFKDPALSFLAMLAKAQDAGR